VGLVEWWLADGWRDVLVHDYAWSLTIAVLWPIAAVVVRANRRRRAATPLSAWWLLPVAAWALQSLGLALMTTQLDVVRGFSRVPFMLMYATTSVIVGVAILLLGLAYTKLLTTPPSFAQPRVAVLSAAAWAGGCARVGHRYRAGSRTGLKSLNCRPSNNKVAADEARREWSLAAELGVLRTQRTNGKEQVGWLSRAKRRVGQGSCRAYSRVSCLRGRDAPQGRRRPISLSAQTRRVMPLAPLQGPASLKARASNRLSRTAAGKRGRVITREIR